MQKKYVTIRTRDYIFYTIIIPFFLALLLSTSGYLNYYFEKENFSLIDYIISTYFIQFLINLGIIIFYKKLYSNDKISVKSSIIKIGTNLYLKLIILAPIIFVIIPILINFFILGNIKFYIIYKYLTLMFLVQLLINIAIYVTYLEYIENK